MSTFLKPIEYGLYSNQFRRMVKYDDDICVLFYKGHSVTVGTWEMFRCEWMNSIQYSNTMVEFLSDVVNDEIGEYFYDNANEQDINTTWEQIFQNLKWDKEDKCEKFNDWKLICLDI